jgi:hypothetical protein
MMQEKGDSGMRRYANILLASVAVAALFLSGTFRQSIPDPLCRSFQASHHFLFGSIYASVSSLNQHKNTLIAAADADSEDSIGDKQEGKDDKDEEDGKLKELWDSVQLG